MAISIGVLMLLLVHDYKDYILVNFLRAEVYREIPQSSAETNIKEKIWSLGTNEMFHMFSTLDKGVDCSGLSYILMRMYSDLGYEAYQAHFGNKKGFTHTVTIVKINYKGKQRFIVEDPTYNITYLDKNGPLDVWQLVSHVRSGRQNEVIIKKPPEQHIVLCSGKEIERNTCQQALDKRPAIHISQKVFAFYVPSDVEGLQQSLSVFGHPRLLTHGNTARKPIQYHLKLTNGNITRNE